MAQQVTQDNSGEGKFYIGAGLTNVWYHIYYDSPKTDEYAVKTGYFHPISLNFGYKANERISVQVGLAYGGSKDSGEWSPGSTDTLLYEAHSRTHVLAIPVAGRLVFFKAFRRFPIYGTATLMPSFGSTKANRTETRHGVITSTEAKDKGMNVFATVGVGFNYRISTRFEGYVEYLFFKRNLTGKNSFDHDWDQFATKSEQIYRSFALGINYRL
ncbi:hypothetical protein GCM10023188_34680 [Pontibacter saemangeumensis]|uniref:Outer membrane protein beta-barrel domain-containing protein n=1 Tax=Pontibacter saemangeumensis TaxID=1084525 RepID=A0ABP8LYB4_9BACT